MSICGDDVWDDADDEEVDDEEEEEFIGSWRRSNTPVDIDEVMAAPGRIRSVSSSSSSSTLLFEPL